MPHTDPRVDAYISRSADFAKPILIHIRQLVHQACPDVEESIKWGVPHLMHHGILCGMAAFKRHCALVFWKRKLIKGLSNPPDGALGQFGRITSISDLPRDRVLLGYIREAARLNEKGVKVRNRVLQQRKTN